MVVAWGRLLDRGAENERVPVLVERTTIIPRSEIVRVPVPVCIIILVLSERT